MVSQALKVVPLLSVVLILLGGHAATSAVTGRANGAGAALAGFAALNRALGG